MRGYKRTLYIPSHRRKYIVKQIMNIDWNYKKPEVNLIDEEIKRKNNERVVILIIVILIIIFLY